MCARMSPATFTKYFSVQTCRHNKLATMTRTRYKSSFSPPIDFLKYERPNSIAGVISSVRELSISPKTAKPALKLFPCGHSFCDSPTAK